MRLKLTFKAVPQQTSPVTKDVVIEVDIIAPEPTLTEAKRFWEMERTFNDLTTGRLHIDLLE